VQHSVFLSLTFGYNLVSELIQLACRYVVERRKHDSSVGNNEWPWFEQEVYLNLNIILQMKRRFPNTFRDVLLCNKNNCIKCVLKHKLMLQSSGEKKFILKGFRVRVSATLNETLTHNPNLILA